MLSLNSSKSVSVTAHTLSILYIDGGVKKKTNKIVMKGINL